MVYIGDIGCGERVPSVCAVGHIAYVTESTLPFRGHRGSTAAKSGKTSVVEGILLYLGKSQCICAASYMCG
jgi:hypothetical protein